jgi:hypothetical protein
MARAVTFEINSGNKTLVALAGLEWKAASVPGPLGPRGANSVNLAGVHGHISGRAHKGKASLFATLAAALPDELRETQVYAAWASDDAIVLHSFDNGQPVIGEETYLDNLDDLGRYFANSSMSDLVCNKKIADFAGSKFQGTVWSFEDADIIDVSAPCLVTRHRVPLEAVAGVVVLAATIWGVLSFMSGDNGNEVQVEVPSVPTEFVTIDPQAFIEACAKQINFSGPRLYRHFVSARGCVLNSTGIDEGLVLSGPVVWQVSKPGDEVNPIIAQRVVELSTEDWVGSLNIGETSITTSLALKVEETVSTSPPVFSEPDLEATLDQVFFGIPREEENVEQTGGANPSSSAERSIRLAGTLSSVLPRLQRLENLDVTRIVEDIERGSVSLTFAPRSARERQAVSSVSLSNGENAATFDLDLGDNK